jgi:hypothetical protein
VAEPTTPTLVSHEVKPATPPRPFRGGRAAVGGDLLDDTIIAKPLTGTGDLFFGLKPKSPNVVFRGINFSVPTKDGVSALRYEQAKAQGFTNATVADVAGTVPTSLQRDNGQKIVHGDLILMKIDAATYRGALKWKDQQALRSVQRFNTETVEQGKHELARAMQEVAAPGKLSRKLSAFSPTSDELKKDFGEGDDE